MNKKKDAFTLVELLAVIAVIALLLAITLPSLAHAKRQAESVYCQNNLRQMMIAAVLYTEHYDGYFPVAYYTLVTDEAMIQFNWDFTVRIPFVSNVDTVPGVITPEERELGTPIVEAGLLWQGGTIEKIQQCPSFRGDSNTFYDPYTGYNYNTSYIGRGDRESIPQSARRDQMTQLASTAVFGDGQMIGGANKFMRAPFRSEGDFSFSDRHAGTQGFRHNRRTNVAWADGSVSSQIEVFTNIEPGRHQETLDNYNRQNHRSPIGFLSPDNSAYKTR